MRLTLLHATAVLALTSPALAATRIDLRTREGVEAVKGTWRYVDVKIVEVTGKAADGSPNVTYNIQPKAFGPDFDDSSWELVD
ncbi:MAG: hypothetical protein AB7I30_00750, partial [Isosphaeraceae bacterium]